MSILGGGRSGAGAPFGAMGRDVAGGRVAGGSAAGGAGRPQAATESAIPYVDERSFEAEVLRSELPVLLAFLTERSPVAKQIAPELDAVAALVENKAKIFKVDVERSAFLAKQLRVQSVPTFLVFAAGRIADMQTGMLNHKALFAMLEPVLPRQPGALKARELAQLIKEGAVVAVDTREAAAFARAHLPGAVNMPIEGLSDRIAELYMLPGPAILYCRAGDKTKDLSATLIEQGVELGFLDGGLLAWESESLPIERGAPKAV